MIYWKGLLYILPIMFVTFIAVFGIVMIGGLFHEWMHTQDFETESLCIDYTNNSFMYVTAAYISLGNYTENSPLTNERAFTVERHFEIYMVEGIIMGALFVLLCLSSFLISKEILIRRINEEYEEEEYEDK